MPVTNKRTFTLYVVIAVAAVIVINLVSRNIFSRWDTTENKMYSLSKSSQQVVEKIDDLLTLKVYFTDNLPGKYANNRRYLQDILEEYAAYSNGKIRFEFYQPASDEKLTEEAQKSGIQPVQLQVVENDKLEIKRVFMGMQFIYEDKREVIPVIQSTTGLEYEITTKIKKLVDDRRRTIAFGTFTGQAPKNSKLNQVLREFYTLRTQDLSQPVPPDYSCLLINGVTDSVSETELQNLRDFIDRGGNVFIAQSRIDADIQEQKAEPIQSNVFDFIKDYGLSLKENLVLDKRNSQVTVTQSRGFYQINSAVDYPFFPRIQTFGDHPTVKGLEQVRILFASEIDIENNTTSNSVIEPLFRTSDQSGSMSGNYNLSPVQNPGIQTLDQEGKTVAALVTVPNSDNTGVSQIILVSDSQFLDDRGSGGLEENTVFVHNAVDYLMGDVELVALRSREITTRPLKEVSDDAKSRIKWLNILLPPLLIIGFGFWRWKLDKKRSKEIEEIYG